MDHYYIGTNEKMKPETVKFHKEKPMVVLYHITLDKLVLLTVKEFYKKGYLLQDRYVFIGTL